MGAISSKLSFVPSGLDSATHRKMTAVIERKHAKVTKLVKVVAVTDPEKEKADMEKAEAKRERERKILDKRQERESMFGQEP